MFESNEAAAAVCMCRREIIINDVFVSHYFFAYKSISKLYQFELSDFLFCCYIDWVNVVACARIRERISMVNALYHPAQARNNYK